MVEAVNAIELKNITKRFGTKVVANDKVNLILRKGEILSLLGENGSGKTTLMNIFDHFIHIQVHPARQTENNILSRCQYLDQFEVLMDHSNTQIKGIFW